MNIKLSEIIPINNQHEYKLHIASWNGQNHPLDVFVRSRKEWDGWNSWKPRKNIFNRQYIFSLIDFYHEEDTWLFGGIYEVLSCGTENYSHSYKVKFLDNAQNFVGRLKVRFKRPGQNRVLKLENYYEDIAVFEILSEVYTGEQFCGYEKINHHFHLLESVFKANKSDWRSALQSIKGIYLITDQSNGKRYVGSAYGEGGIWSRWACYIGTGHGWTDELTKLIKKEGIQYARRNFKFALLEFQSMMADDKTIIKREGYWKDVLLTRGDYGYNKN